MDKGTSLTLAKQYASIVSRELNPDKIILYGSHLQGTATEESDIDITIIFNNFDGDWLVTYTYISRLRRSVSAYIEPVLLDSANDSSGFIDEILERGEMLYMQ